MSYGVSEPMPFILRVCCYSGLVFQVVNTILVMHDKPCTMLDAYGGAQKNKQGFSEALVPISTGETPSYASTLYK